MPAAAQSPLLNENFILNGDMFIAQQGALSGVVALAATAALTVDQWKLSGNLTAATANINQVLSHPILNRGVCLSVKVVNPDAVVGANDSFQIQTLIEGYTARRFYSVSAQFYQPFSVQFWAWSTVPGIYALKVRDIGNAYDYVADYIIQRASTWEFFNIPIFATGIGAGGGEQNTNQAALSINWCLMTGAAEAVAPALLKSWYGGGSFDGSPNQTNLLAAVNNEFRLADVQLNASIFSKAYQRESFAVTLQKCQRYYWQTFDYGNLPASNHAQGAAGAIGYASVNAGAVPYSFNFTYPVEMRGAPIITSYNPLAAGANWRNTSTPANSGAFTAPVISAKMALIRNAQAAADAANERLQVHLTLDSRL